MFSSLMAHGYHVTYLCLFLTQWYCMLLVPEGYAGEAWGLSKIYFCFGNLGRLVRELSLVLTWLMCSVLAARSAEFLPCAKQNGASCVCVHDLLQTTLDLKRGSWGHVVAECWTNYVVRSLKCTTYCATEIPALGYYFDEMLYMRRGIVQQISY
jgi:hypothetical protein